MHLTLLQSLAEAFEEICVLDAPLNEQPSASADKHMELDSVTLRRKRVPTRWWHAPTPAETRLERRGKVADRGAVSWF